ncbi:MAG: extracellular solute-binding protein, partial [Paenibacillaceae bacterium]|nr:extracellular solute-binding protein [Paenibacillaceae bacterium]
MNARKWRKVSLAALIGTVTVVSACSKGGESSSGSSSPSPSTAASSSPSASVAPSVANGPLTKYPQEITVTTVRSANAATKYQAGDTLDSNIWTKSFKSDLNINVTNKWTVSDQQFKNKLTVSMVSGDLPDFFLVDDQQLQLLVQAGQIMDLTDLYNKYATDLTKQTFGNDMKSVRMQAAAFGGKLMAIPN